MNENVAVFIPACGFGTRVNMQPHESKEMLLDKSGKPLINYSIELCEDLSINPTIITRKEKQTLINHVKGKMCDILIIEPEGEWPTTILKSKHLWKEKNLLILPDTRFNPTRILKHMIDSLDYKEISFAIHEVKDIKNWGEINKLDGSSVEACEKPNKEGPGTAWGIIAWRQEVGEELFSLFTEKNNRQTFNNVVCLKLNKFEDITR